jgi:hypothetical protein
MCVIDEYALIHGTLCNNGTQPNDVSIYQMMMTVLKYLNPKHTQVVTAIKYDKKESLQDFAKLYGIDEQKILTHES